MSDDTPKSVSIDEVFGSARRQLAEIMADPVREKAWRREILRSDTMALAYDYAQLCRLHGMDERAREATALAEQYQPDRVRMMPEALGSEPAEEPHGRPYSEHLLRWEDIHPGKVLGLFLVSEGIVVSAVLLALAELVPWSTAFAVLPIAVAVHVMRRTGSRSVKHCQLPTRTTPLERMPTTPPGTRVDPVDLGAPRFRG